VDIPGADQVVNHLFLASVFMVQVSFFRKLSPFANLVNVVPFGCHVLQRPNALFSRDAFLDLFQTGTCDALSALDRQLSPF